MKLKRISVIMLCLFMCVVMGGEMILSAFSIPANAEGEVGYTNVYNDLKADQSFDPGKYPRLSPGDPGYYNIELITIAESEDNELFVYVYQPSGSNHKGESNIEGFRASSINISQFKHGNVKEQAEGRYFNCELEFINSYDVFFKYKVKDFTVNSVLSTRYYEITSIYRPWSSAWGDAGVGGGNTISETPFAVGKQFTFTTGANGSTSVQAEDVEYIRITDKYVGYIRYDGDIFPLYVQDASTDAHFVAFSTDKPIDKLLEADLYYQTQTVTTGVSAGAPINWYGEKVDQYAYLDYKQQAICNVSDGSIFTKSEHMWDRIQTTSQFLSQQVPIFSFAGFDVSDEIQFTGEAYEALARTDWVLSFTETGYLHTTNWDGGWSRNYTRVGNVSLLRLKFETDGVVYDLGVVDNKQTGSEDPAAVVERQEWWQKIIMLLLLILLVVVLSSLSGPVGFVFKIIWNSLKFIFSILIWLIGLPYKLILWIFGKKRKRR